MSKEQNITNNIKVQNQNIEVLKKHFGQCFDKSGNFDFEKFKQELSENEIDFYKESYGIDWLGKSYARVLASDPTTTLLKEDEEFNSRKENKDSENLLIKGDNLEVLKHLTNAYYEKIKMIYIDPPYNTGNDGFVYEDTRKYSLSELMTIAGIDESKAKRIIEFTQSKSNSHSAWLTFMYPRLYLAKTLLIDEGVIFVSIDDNEATQLKYLLDEVFGEENFVSKIPTVMNLKGNQDSFGFAETHEYFFVYAKNKEKCVLNKFDLNEEEIMNDWKEDEYGLYKEADNLRATGENAPRTKRPNLWYPIFLDEETAEFYITDDDKPHKKSDTVIYPINPEGEELSWYWGKTTFNEKKHNLILKETSNGWQFYRKQRPELGDLPTKKPKSFFYKSDYSTSTATTQLKNLFGKKIFKGPKPVPFILDLIKIGMNKEDVVLDFFGGSGTTAEAVLRLNISDGGNRKFILVQLPELIDSKRNKIAFEFVKNELGIETPSIFDITKQRIILCSKSLLSDYPKIEHQKLGFKVFETKSIWEDYGFDSKELSDQTKLFDETKLNEEDIKALLITWKTFDGSPLTEQVTTHDFDGYSGHYVNSKLYLMDKGFSTKNLSKLLEKIDSDKNFNPTSIIAFGYHFNSKNLREISENIKSYANKKNIDIDFITRY